MLKIQVGDTVFEAELENNSSAKALKEKLEIEPLLLNMNDFSNFEKVGNLPWKLPQNNKQITTKPGDLILYLGNQLVIYYDTNSWKFTPVGKIKNVNVDKLREVLGKDKDSVTVKFSIDEEA